MVEDSGSWPTVKRGPAVGVWLEVVSIWMAVGCCMVEIVVGSEADRVKVEGDAMAGVVRGSMGVEVYVVVSREVREGLPVVRKRRAA